MGINFFCQFYIKALVKSILPLFFKEIYIEISCDIDKDKVSKCVTYIQHPHSIFIEKRRIK